MPLLVLTIYPALRSIYYLPIQGTVSGSSLFDDDFLTACAGVTAFVMIGYALRERMPEFSFSAAAVQGHLSREFCSRWSQPKGDGPCLLVRLAQ